MKIYSDNLIEYDWFKNLNNNFKDLDFEIIKSRGKNPHIIEQVIKYDRPDIILADENKIFLLVEKTREVPTGHNVGQRMARLIRAVELGIPTIYFCPFKAKKHGKYSSICYMNARLFKCFYKIWDIHKSAIHLLNWRCDYDGELINDGSEDKEIKEIINLYVLNNYKVEENILKSIKENLLTEYNKSLESFKQYGKPPPSISINKTSSIIKNIGNIDALEKTKLLKNLESVLYKIEIKESKSAKRQDPYTGMQFIYDYLYCRKGVSSEDKYRNLILHFPQISKNFWLSINSNNYMSKSSNWYLTANGMLFKDGYFSIR